jgi:4-hydroxythreonine-4-phosphate dehydrogenase
MIKKRKAIIGITIGDPNGIGPEVILKALSDQRMLNHLTPVIFGSAKLLNFYRKLLKLDDVPTQNINEGQEPHAKRINIVDCWTGEFEVKVGQPDVEAGKNAFMALEKANEWFKAGKIDAIVTAPINKATIQSDNFDFPGHTEYFGNRYDGEPLMFMVAGDLRIAVYTGHVSLKEVSGLLNREKLQHRLGMIINSLKKDFGIAKPKVAVLGVNPHAGEDGLLGQEEKDVILPVIEEAKKNGDLVFGPYPADGFFGSSNYRKYDGILAMYHDQGLIPFKSMSFGNGVNFTANLDVVRTSPDHGTAFDIAGKGTSSESSMREAIYLAHDILKNRTEEEFEEEETE